MKWFTRFWPVLFVGYLFFWRVFDRHLPAIWGMRWELLLSLIFVVLAVKAVEKFQNKLFIVACCGLFCNLLRISGQSEYIQLLEFVYAGYLAAILVFLFILSKVERHLLILSLSCVGIFTALAIYTGRTQGHDMTVYSPIFENPSMAGSFMAVSMAFCSPFLALLVYGAILLTHTYTGIIAGAVVLAFEPKFRTQKWGTFFIILFFLIITQATGDKIMTGNGRYRLWSEVMGWWIHHDWETLLFGVGLGSAGPLLHAPGSLIAIIQAEAHDTRGTYLWLHSDWVQILFEQGFLGFFSAIAIFVMALFKSKNSSLTAAIIAYSIVMVTNFPWHWPVHAIFGGVILATVFGEKSRLA